MLLAYRNTCIEKRICLELNKNGNPLLNPTSFDCFMNILIIFKHSILVSLMISYPASFLIVLKGKP